MRGVYEVEVVDRTTGEGRWVKVEAAGPEAAQAKILALGEMVGTARIVEVLSASTVASGGACPKCDATRWTGGRGSVRRILMVLLFPIGLLFLLVRPKWTCAKCGYSYESYTAPQREHKEPQPMAMRLAAWIAFLALIAAIVAVLTESRWG